jgi:hypothetical protein
VSADSICSKNPLQLTANQLLTVQLLGDAILNSAEFEKFRKEFVHQGINGTQAPFVTMALTASDTDSVKFAERMAYGIVAAAKGLNHFQDLASEKKRESFAKACSQMLITHHSSAWDEVINHNQGKECSPFDAAVLTRCRTRMFGR